MKNSMSTFFMDIDIGLNVSGFICDIERHKIL